MSGAWERSPALRSRSRQAASRRPRAGRAADHGRRRQYEGPREDRQRRRETRRPARRSPPGASWDFSIRFRWSGCGAWAPPPPSGCTIWGSRPSASSPGVARSRLSPRSVGRRAATFTISLTTAILGGCARAVVVARSGRKARSAAVALPRGPGRPARRPGRPRHPADAGSRAGRPHRRASTSLQDFSRACRSHTLPRPRRPPGRPRGRALAACGGDDAGSDARRRAGG